MCTINYIQRLMICNTSVIIWHVFQSYTGHFIMFSMITNIYNKKPEGPTLMQLFTATGKLKKFFLTTRDVWCVHRGWHGTHRYSIQILATHMSTWVHWYSSLLQWAMPLGQRGHVAMVGRILCTVTTDLLMWHSNTQNNFSPRAAIFSLHTFASPNGRTVNYNEKQLTGKKIVWVVPSICTGFVNTCPTIFL